MPSFKGFISLGDASKYETAMRIPVERYFRTYVAKPPSASSFAMRSGGQGQEAAEAGAGQSTSGGEALTTVRMSRTYQINDESAPGGKVDVERDDLAKGYEYGRTAVHISQTDENITSLETFAGLEIIGFVQMNKVCSAHNEVLPRQVLTLLCSMIDTCTCRIPMSSSHSEQMTNLRLRCHL